MGEIVAYSTLALTMTLAVSRPRVGVRDLRFTPGVAALAGATVLLLAGLLRLDLARLPSRRAADDDHLRGPARRPRRRQRRSRPRACPLRAGPGRALTGQEGVRENVATRPRSVRRTRP
jgi:hypothetical protein